MKFNATHKVDFAQWKNVKMERENSVRDARPMEEETPKFGAGSEYNREFKEEMRRKKFGFQPKKAKQGNENEYEDRSFDRVFVQMVILIVMKLSRFASVDIENWWEIG